MVSANTRCETQAPKATKASACCTCLWSSRAISRTRTLVSIARIALAHAGANALVHFRKASALWWPLRKQYRVNILRAVSSGAAHHHFLAAFFPFQSGARAHAQFFAYARRNGNLTLRGNF